MPYNEAADSQVREYIHTWNTNTLAIKTMRFQVRLGFHTWECEEPTECSVTKLQTRRCVNIFAPGTQTLLLSSGCGSRCAWFSTPESEGDLCYFEIRNVQQTVMVMGDFVVGEGCEEADGKIFGLFR